MLTYAIQDEYLALAEYELIIEKYGSMRPFSNIINSEKTHIDMFLKKELPDDIRSVFERLKNASGNHLQAFKNGLNRY